jgi:hypothetical protein
MINHETASGSGDDEEGSGLPDFPIIDNRYTGDTPATPFGANRMLDFSIIPIGEVPATVADQLACHPGEAASGAFDDAGDAFGHDHPWPEEL